MAHVMLVTHKGTTPTNKYLELIQTCINAGISSVQLREKSLSIQERIEFALALKKILDKAQIPLIINDDVELCREIDAAGVHLGQSDSCVVEARARLGIHKMIGQTVNCLDEIIKANQLPIDYIGVGAIFKTNNKPDIQTIWGLDGLKSAKAIAKHPIIAIGGIDEHNAYNVINAGADGIAAIGAFHNSDNPYETTCTLLNNIRRDHHD